MKSSRQATLRLIRADSPMPRSAHPPRLPRGVDKNDIEAIVESVQKRVGLDEPEQTLVRKRDDLGPAAVCVEPIEERALSARIQLIQVLQDQCSAVFSWEKKIPAHPGAPRDGLAKK